VKDAIENMRIEIWVLIKERIFMNLSEEAAMEYESSRKRAFRDSLETASTVKKK